MTVAFVLTLKGESSSDQRAISYDPRLDYAGIVELPEAGAALVSDGRS